ncbi:Hypothetical protein AA314_00521 [Archangium gephyra]|uniref:Uncharacterized protein n=1 Tax=Archangium gephyra TaxID=48 RepID=A0AAC8Q0Q4_9BACT|nr:Hypothetical protein AA314_00521 [Archangium gephyra]
MIQRRGARSLPQHPAPDIQDGRVIVDDQDAPRTLRLRPEPTVRSLTHTRTRSPIEGASHPENVRRLPRELRRLDAAVRHGDCPPGQSTPAAPERTIQ